MVANLAKSGQNDYALSNARSFDAWGNVRIGLSTGNPTGRYCANLGHKQDDESGLIYMRARYYEPTSGRFTSEDPTHQERNLFAYCMMNPVDGIDKSGTITEWSSAWWTIGLGFQGLSVMFIYFSAFVSGKDAGILTTAAMGAAGMAVFAFSMALIAPGMSLAVGATSALYVALMAGSGPWLKGCIATAIEGAKKGCYTTASNVVMFNFCYSLEVMGALLAIDMEAASGS